MSAAVQRTMLQLVHGRTLLVTDVLKVWRINAKSMKVRERDKMYCARLVTSSSGADPSVYWNEIMLEPNTMPETACNIISAYT